MRVLPIGVLLNLILLVTVYSQDFIEELEKDFSTYTSMLVEQDFANSVEYLPEALFEIVPKETMIQAMEMVFNNPDMEMNIYGYSDLETYHTRQEENTTYVLFNYSSSLSMKVNLGEEEEEIAEKKDLYLNAFKMAFGVDNVQFNEETGSYQIQADKKACAISSDGKTNWKFLVLEEDQAQVIQQILPPSVVAEI